MQNKVKLPPGSSISERKTVGYSTFYILYGCFIFQTEYSSQTNNETIAKGVLHTSRAHVYLKYFMEHVLPLSNEISMYTLLNTPTAGNSIDPDVTFRSYSGETQGYALEKK